MSKVTERYNMQYASFDVDTSMLTYTNLRNLYVQNGESRVYPVRAMYINRKSEYGDAPVIATDVNLVNLPVGMLTRCEALLKDVEAISEIKSGIIGFRIYTYVSKKSESVCYSIEFVDM